METLRPKRFSKPITEQKQKSPNPESKDKDKHEKPISIQNWKLCY